MNAKLEIKSGRVNLYHQYPDHATTRVVVVPGYGESFTHTKPVVDALAAEGYDAFTFNLPRRSVREVGRHKMDSITGSSRQLNEALTLLLSAEDKIYGLAHSLGAAVLLKAAQQSPGRFAGLILMQPVGLAEPQTLPQLIHKVSAKAANNQRLGSSIGKGRRLLMRGLLASGSRIALQPGLAMREAVAAGRYDIADDLKAVNGLHIPVHLVISAEDELFSYEQASQSMEILNSLVENHIVLGEPGANTHDIFWLQPALTAEIAKRFMPL